MDTIRWSRGQLAAGAGGVLLAIALFLPWFCGLRRGTTFNAWEIQTTTDVFLLLVAVIAVVSAVVPRRGYLLAGTTMNGITALLGGVATVLVLWLVAFDFPDVFNREIGPYVALVAGAGITLGAYTAARSQADPRAPSSVPADGATFPTPAELIVAAGGTLLFISLFCHGLAACSRTRASEPTTP